MMVFFSAARTSPIFIIKLVMIILTVAASSVTVTGKKSAQKRACEFPAIYNFGDSNSDTGGIAAALQPLNLPYGETFFKRSSGRCSDGRNMIDFMAETVGLPYLSAYLNSIGTNFSHGANFATGGSTIRRQNETFFVHGISPFSLDVQILQFDQFKSRTIDLYNQASVRARRMGFWVHNTGPIGCLPFAKWFNRNPPLGSLDQYGCFKAQNEIAMEFNRQLKAAIVKLRTHLSQAAITYVDLYATKYGLISTSKIQGFDYRTKVCCGYHEKDGNVGFGQKGLTNNGTSVTGQPCPRPQTSISWDGVHYTEAANHWFANHILNGSVSEPQVPFTHACYRN